MTELELLKRKLEREKLARKQAEEILESKALELYEAGIALRKLNESLENKIRKRTQDLQESEAKYRNVVEKASDIIYSTDHKGIFTFINPIGCDAFSYSEEEIIGKNFLDFVPEAEKPRILDYYSELRNKGSSNDYNELPIRSKTGKIYWIGQNVNRITKPNGEFYFIAVARDITLRKKAEEELEKTRQALVQSEVKYRSVLENMDLGLMEVDPKGRITRVYDRFCIMTGYTKEELLGKDAIDTFVVEEYKELLQNQTRNRLKGESKVYEIQIKRKDNKNIWVMISGAPFYDTDGKIIGSLGIHYDITPRKKLESNLEIAKEKAVRAQQAEQQFLANMSHEIRTPLNAIIGMSHLLSDSDLSQKQKEYVEILSSSGNLLKGLVSDILDISKIDSGIVEINETSFELNALANKLIKTFSIQAEERNIRIKNVLKLDENQMIDTDLKWMNQILINLIGNALKFTQEGEVTLTIKKLKENENSGLFYFEVEDTGIGINRNDRKKIFSSFKQANKNIRNDFGGTGLGLSIASRLVELLGGELEVESTLGKGSKFFFSLNLKMSSVKSIGNSDLSQDSGSSIEGVKVLVVEDNQMNQKYILSLLEKWKVQFDLAENGQEALEKYKLNHYDMIFMDLSMPIMDGYEATEIIRSLPGKQVPIIALTASTFLSKRELALKSGMSDFLAKPFVPEDLKSMIRKHLSFYIEEGKFLKEKPVFNEALNVLELTNLYGDDFQYALDMFTTFKEIVDEEISLLSSCIKEGDKAEVQNQAHKIKPIFSMVGLSELSQICEQIEKEVNGPKFDILEEKFQSLKKILNQKMPLIDNQISELNDLIRNRS